jgi:hypothetical protein
MVKLLKRLALNLLRMLSEHIGGWVIVREFTPRVL